MASLRLCVCKDIFNWPLPDDLEEITVTQLKEQIKDQFKLLYHQKLRFAPEDERDGQLDDSARVPQAPRVVKVQGPTSVVQMLELGLRSRDKAVEKKTPAQPVFAQFGAAIPSTGSTRPMPAAPSGGYGGNGFTRSTPAALSRGYGGKGGCSSTNGSALGQGVKVKVIGLQVRPELNGLQGTVVDYDRASGRWQVRLDGNTRPQLFKTSSLVLVPSWQQQQPFASTGGTFYQEAFAAQQMVMAEELELQDLELAIQASRMGLEADEEAQLAWALAESARLAENEAAKIETEAPSGQSSNREPACAAVPCNADEDSDDESDNFDDLPPLVPLRSNSEE